MEVREQLSQGVPKAGAEAGLFTVESALFFGGGDIIPYSVSYLETLLTVATPLRPRPSTTLRFLRSKSVVTLKSDSYSRGSPRQQKGRDFTPWGSLYSGTIDSLI